MEGGHLGQAVGQLRRPPTPLLLHTQLVHPLESFQVRFRLPRRTDRTGNRRMPSPNGTALRLFPPGVDGFGVDLGKLWSKFLIPYERKASPKHLRSIFNKFFEHLAHDTASFIPRRSMKGSFVFDCQDVVSTDTSYGIGFHAQLHVCLVCVMCTCVCCIRRSFFFAGAHRFNVNIWCQLVIGQWYSPE